MWTKREMLRVIWRQKATWNHLHTVEPDCHLPPPTGIRLLHPCKRYEYAVAYQQSLLSFMQCVHDISLFCYIGAIECLGCVCYIGKLRKERRSGSCHCSGRVT